MIEYSNDYYLLEYNIFEYKVNSFIVYIYHIQIDIYKFTFIIYEIHINI